MVGILVLSHGGLADELLDAARRIAGDLDGFAALTLGWDESVESARQRVRETVERLDTGDGVLILTDIYGGTPTNLALGLDGSTSVAVVAGANLPMVVRLGCLYTSGMTLEQMAEWISDKGRESICTSTPTSDSMQRSKAS